MCKRKHEYEIERQIFTSEKFYNVDKKLASIESELKEIKDLDMCVLGVNLYNIHSTLESVEIESMIRVYNWLIKALENME